MINPSPSALRRRARELRNAANRELANDADSAALLCFYAAECGLKSAYMRRNNLKSTDEMRGTAQSARTYGHRLDQLIRQLRIPASVLPSMPSATLKRTGVVAPVGFLHEAWRYGESVVSTDELYKWLIRIEEWAWRDA